MNGIIKKSIKLLIISLAICFLFVFFGYQLNLTALIFVYLLSLLLAPYWLMNIIRPGVKFLLIALVSFFSVATIIYFDGIDKTLYRYVVTFGVVVIFSIIWGYIKRNNKD